MNDKSQFATVERWLCREVMGLTEGHAIAIIEKNGCLAFVEQRDKKTFEPHCGTAHSYRILLTIHKGKVSNTSVG